jgi:hypothetical protein
MCGIIAYLGTSDLLHPAIDSIVIVTNAQTVERVEHSALHALAMEVDGQ